MPSQHLKTRQMGAVNWVGLQTIIRREISRFTTVYLQTLIAPMVTTMLFYTIFALAFGGLSRTMGGMPFLTFLAPGLVMMTMVQNAFTNTSSSLVISKIQKNIVDILMPPLSSIELLIGMLVGGVARGLCIGILTTGVMFIFADIQFTAPLVSIAFAILGTVMLSALGVVAGLWADRFDNIASITNFVVTPLAFLSGTFYSIKTLPEAWQGIAIFNPFFYMIDGFRAGFIGQSDSVLWMGACVLIVANVVLIATILWMLETGYKIKA